MNLRLSSALSAIVIVVAGSGAAAINFAVLDNHGPEKTNEIGLGVIAPAADPTSTLAPSDGSPSANPSSTSDDEPTDSPSGSISPSTGANPVPSSTFKCNDVEDDDEDDEDEDSEDDESEDDFDDDNCGDD